MEWQDEAIILSVRPHGETAAVVNLLTPEQGRHAGLVAGGQGRRLQGLLQPGNLVQARWRARLEDHLGNFTLDLHKAHAAAWLDHQEVLAIILSICAVTEASLPERQPMAGVYAGVLAALSLPEAELWGPAYVQWEISLLRALGYGMDLSRCAVSGASDNLTHVSPRTGRAVTAEAAAPYQEKLLALPGFLLGDGDSDAAAMGLGLELTGHFLSRHVFANPHSRILIPQAGDLPLPRQRLQEFYRRLADKNTALAG